MNKPVRICGEISSNPFIAVLCSGYGIHAVEYEPHVDTPDPQSASRGSIGGLEKDRKNRPLTFITAHEVQQIPSFEAVSKLVGLDLTAYAKEIAPPAANLEPVREVKRGIDKMPSPCWRSSIGKRQFNSHSSATIFQPPVSRATNSALFPC